MYTGITQAGCLGRAGRGRVRRRRLLRGPGGRTRVRPGAGPRAGPHGITATSVAPGLIGTDITGGALQGERKAALLAGTPVGRVGTVADVADLITYRCRQESGYIIGATYDVDGGSHIH